MDVAFRPELDVTGPGVTIEEATATLNKAVALFLEWADPGEITRQHHGEALSVVSCRVREWA